MTPLYKKKKAFWDYRLLVAANLQTLGCNCTFSLRCHLTRHLSPFFKFCTFDQPTLQLWLNRKMFHKNYKILLWSLCKKKQKKKTQHFPSLSISRVGLSVNNLLDQPLPWQLRKLKWMHWKRSVMHSVRRLRWVVCSSISTWVHSSIMCFL